MKHIEKSKVYFCDESSVRIDSEIIDMNESRERSLKSIIPLAVMLDLIDPDREGVTVGITTDWAEFDYLRTSRELFDHIRADAMVSGIGVEQGFIVLQLEELV